MRAPKVTGNAITHRTTQTPIETIIGKAITVMPNGCWAYRGSLTRRAQTVTRAGSVMVYRFVYETLVGPIPEGHDLPPPLREPRMLQPAAPRAHDPQ
jgi:hypothetical protein